MNLGLDLLDYIVKNRRAAIDKRLDGRETPYLFVCHSGPRIGKPISQRNLNRIAEAVRSIPIADRETFIFANALPKHLTDVGGCTTDWSLDPCKQHGDCLRCDQHIWRKGDKARLAHVKSQRKHAVEMISKAESKLESLDSPLRSLLQQYQQFKDSVTRCDAILAIESDPSITVGTIATFSAAANSVSDSQRITLLREQISPLARKEDV